VLSRRTLGDGDCFYRYVTALLGVWYHHLSINRYVYSVFVHRTYTAITGPKFGRGICTYSHRRNKLNSPSGWLRSNGGKLWLILRSDIVYLHEGQYEDFSDIFKSLIEQVVKPQQPGGNILDSKTLLQAFQTPEGTGYLALFLSSFTAYAEPPSLQLDCRLSSTAHICRNSRQS